MRETRKTRPSIAVPERAKMEAETGQAATSVINSTTQAAKGQSFRIADFLSHGAENGVTLRHLETLTGIPGREIRRCIEQERRAGTLIISDNQSGYFLTDDPAEAQRFAKSMRHRASQIRQTATAIEKAAGLL